MGHTPTRQERLDVIASTIRMAAQFRRLRHTRRCERCNCFLAVDQPDLRPR